MAMQSPPEELGYLALIKPRQLGRLTRLTWSISIPGPPAMVGSSGQTDMPHQGDELHHFGWNACSSYICPYGGAPWHRDCTSGAQVCCRAVSGAIVEIFGLAPASIRRREISPGTTMNDYSAALLLAMLPATGNVAGGMLAELVAVSQRTLSLALHAAAGIVLAVVAVELMPEAMQATSPWIVVLAFVAGGAVFVAADHGLAMVRARSGGSGQERGPWLIFVGVAIDLFSDGVMIGTAANLSPGLALLLALGQVPADIPEGFATVAGFKARGIPRRARLALSGSFAIPILLGTMVGYFAVRDQPEVLKLALLAFTAGVLTTVVVEEIVPEAHEDGEARFAALVFVGGFALFALLSAYLG
jgi:zinc transporter, ZIP family